MEGVPRKPDPTSAFEMALALNTLPANIGFVGDTAVDMKVARAAGMTAIGVLWGFRDRAELESNGAHHVLSTPDELLALIDR
jgi:phosphoglycolate phosphatase